jgi:hypothetical protein
MSWRLLARRSRTGLASALIPVALGVLLAFVCNVAGSLGSTAGQGLSPEVGVAVQQAATQAWASTMPATTTPAFPADPGTPRPAAR